MVSILFYLAINVVLGLFVGLITVIGIMYSVGLAIKLMDKLANWIWFKFGD